MSSSSDDRLAASAAALLLTVRTPTGPVPVVVELDQPTPWAVVGPQVRALAGLPATAVLHAGWVPLTAAHRVGVAPLLSGAVLDVVPGAPVGTATGLVLDCVAGPDAGRSAPVGPGLLVGRSPAVGLTLADPALSHRQLRLDTGAARAGAADRGLVVTDLGSTNGTRVLRTGPGSGTVPGAVVVGLGDAVRAGSSVLRLELAAPSPMLGRPDGRGRLLLTLPATARTSPDTGDDPELASPPAAPAAPQRRALPWLASGLGAAAAAAVAALTGMWVFLLLALAGPVTVLATTAGDRASDRRSHRRALREHRRALQDHRDRTAELVRADHQRSWSCWSDPARLLRAARSADVGLWTVDPAAGVPVVLSVGDRPTRCRTGAALPTTRCVPLVTTLPTTGVVGLSGAAPATLRWLVAQLVGTVPPHRLSLHLLTDDPVLDVLAGVPHVAGGPRLPARDPAGLLAALIAAPNPAGAVTAVVVDDAARWHDDPQLHRLLERDDLLVLLAARTADHLPRTCTRTLALDALPGTAVGIAPDHLAELARALTPLTVPAAPAAGPVLLRAPDAPAVRRRWSTAGRPVATIGRGRDGPVTLDLQRDGPHLLVAGTTGSGKSELLLTLTCALAGELPPDRLSVLAVDYKGGAAFAALAGLPHLCGTITDLDPGSARRALRSIRAEIRRREALQAAGAPAPGQPGGAALLVVVVDEFAALAADLPDFLAGLVDVAQRGRSLGVHLVLATQRPAGVVTPAIRANVGTRICLRVTDAAESVDVLGVPDAARLPAGRPGSAVLLRPGGRPEPVRIAAVSSGAPPLPRVRLLAGPRSGDDGTAAGPDAAAVVDTPTALQRCVTATAAATSALGLVPAPPPWVPPPDSQAPPTDPQVLGLLDLVDQQRVVPWRLTNGAVLVTGPPRSGRSTAARRWAAAVAADGGRLVVLDASGDLAGLAGLGVVDTLLRLPAAGAALRALRRTAELVRADTCRGLGLLVDGVDDWLVELEQLDPAGAAALLTELVAHGPGRGLRCLLTAGPRQEHHRVTAGRTETLRLGGLDRWGEPVPGSPPGTGTLVGPLCPDGAPLLVARPGQQQPGTADPAAARVAVRELPARHELPLADVPGSAIPAPLPVGPGGDEGSPVWWDPGEQAGSFVVTGTPGSGVSTALVTLAALGRHRGWPVLLAGPPGGRPDAARAELAAPPCPRAGDPAALRRDLAALTGPVLLVVDDPGALEDGWGELLTTFLRGAAPGQRLVTGLPLHRSGPGADGRFRGLLLGGGPADARTRGLDPALVERSSPPGRGLLVDGGPAVPLQLSRLRPPRSPGSRG